MSRRIVLASRLFTPEVSAGAFRLGALAAALAKRGDHVDVVTTTPPAHAPERTDIPGVRVSRWPALRDRGGNVRGYLQYMSFDVPLLFRIIFRRFDVLIAESPPTTALACAAVAALHRRPLVYYAADVWTDGVIAMGAAKPVIAVMRWMERAVLKRAAAILSVSDEVTERLTVLDADPERIATVGNGIDTTIFRPDIGVPAPGERYFVYTGTMSEWQRPDVFVRALAQIAQEHPDIGLRFFGQGALEGSLRALAEDLVPGRVTFGGVVSPAESARWIRGAIAALVSVAPGIGYDFARPTKTYAAAACGTPVLFTGADVGGAIVRTAGLGITVTFTPEEIAAGMRRLIDDDQQGATDSLRLSRCAWVAENASLTSVGNRAAEVVARTADGQ